MDYLSRFARSELDSWRRWRYLARTELILALAALVVGVASSIYLAILLLGEHEACYGMSSAKLQCEPIGVVAAERFVVVLGYFLLPLIIALLATRWQLHTPDPAARSVAYWTLFSCALLVFGGVVPALSGPGFFLLPTALLTAASAIVGAIVWWQARKEGSAYALLETAGAHRPEQGSETD